MLIGRTDVFEREYISKFRNIAGTHGEFVSYERDRGARDIGLHLTRKQKSGSERVSPTLCWFQLKGITKGRLPKGKVKSAGYVSVKLEVEHLRFWYVQPMPTYLCVYVESLDDFLAVNIQRYVDDNYGNTIFKLDQKTKIVRISLNNKLDDHAFNLILKTGELDQWRKLFFKDQRTTEVFQRDYEVIKRIGTAESRGVEIKMTFVDWISKLRTEVSFEERSLSGDGEWVGFRGHWQLHLPKEELELAFPYLNFVGFDEDEQEEFSEQLETGNYIFNPIVVIELSDGKLIYGEDCSSEFEHYEMRPILNDLGHGMLQTLKVMEKAHLIEAPLDATSFISVAPWHARDL